MKNIKKHSGIIIVILIALANVYYFGYKGNDAPQLPFGSNSSSSYQPVKVGGPLPKEIFGLTNAGNGKWKDADGNVVYQQARVYAGSSKSQPLPVLREDGCIYDKNKVVTVDLDSNKYPASSLHIYLAIRNGVPQKLHINRNPDYDLRGKSLQGIPSNSTFDRDEFPFALSNEAVVYNREKGTSDIAFIPLSDNRGSGSSMGNALSDYCQGQAFRINLVPSS
jgi:hypothetical protein